MKHLADSISGRIVAQCDTPHTLGQIQAAFAPDDIAKHGRGSGGVFVQTALKHQFWPQEPPGRKPRLKRVSDEAEAPPPPPPAPAPAPTTKRRVVFQTHVPRSPLDGGPKWSSLELVNAWAGPTQQPQDESHA